MHRRWWALVLLCSAQFLVVLDASVVNVALPAIGQDLGVDQRELAWVVSAYVLAFGGFLLLGGRLADLLGRRRVFLAGLVLFGVASMVGGFADSIVMLIGARAGQGLGAALLSPAAMSIIAVTFDDGAERNRAYAAWGAVGGAGGAVGVVLSGLLTQYAGWQWILWINVPIVACCVLLTIPLLAETRIGSSTRTFDVAGAAAVAAGLTLLVYALIEAPVALLGAVALLVAFVVIERRSAAPLVDLRIFRLRTLTGANVAGVLVGAVLMPMFFFLSLHIQDVLRYDAITTGLCLVPMSLVTFGVSLGLASRLVTRFGFKPVLAAGFTLLAVGLAGLGTAAPHGSFLSDLLAPGLVAGAGLGLTFTPLFVAASTGVGWQQAGLASGLINTSQQIGSALGLAVVAGIAFARIAAQPAATPEVLTAGYTTAFVLAACLAVLGLIATAVLIPGRDHVQLSQAR